MRCALESLRWSQALTTAESAWKRTEMKNANSDRLGVPRVSQPVGDDLRSSAVARTSHTGSSGAEPYCIPKGTLEDAYAVGHAIAELLDALDAVNESTCDGEITTDTANLGYLILARLKSEGWQVRLTAVDRWEIRPPAPRSALPC